MLGAEISTTSIRRIVAEKRRPPAKRETWRQFMRSQASSIIACDLFTVESVRLKTLHVLFFIDLHTRKVLIGGVTDGAANAAWCAQIARNLTEVREGRDEPIRYLVHDRDKRFCPVFDEVFRAEGSRSCALRGGHRRPTPMPNGSSGRSAPSASIGCSSWANGIFDRCWRPTSSTTTASDRIAGSILLRRKEPQTLRRYASTTRSDVVISWVA